MTAKIGHHIRNQQEKTITIVNSLSCVLKTLKKMQAIVFRENFCCKERLNDQVLLAPEFDFGKKKIIQGGICIPQKKNEKPQYSVTLFCFNLNPFLKNEV